MEYFQLVCGLALLILGADWLVKHASQLAKRFGVSTLVIGLTVIGFGTSTPELIVSATSSFQGQTEIATANVLGSNIFNILFILGLAATITPLTVSQQLLRVDVPLMVAASLTVFLLALNNGLSRLEGLVLIGGLVAYTWMILKIGSENSATEVPFDSAAESSQTNGELWKNIVWIVAGLGMLVFGSKLFVVGAITLAANLGVSREVIGLTIVAAGTSLPEVVASVVASLRGQRDMAVGNVVGSNLFNLLGVLGVSAIVAPSGLAVSEAALRFDFPVMLSAAAACFPIFLTGRLVNRWEGGLFLGAYVAYTAWLIGYSTL